MVKNLILQNFASEFNDIKDTLFNKKVARHK